MTPEQKAARLDRLRWRYHNEPAYRERVLEQQREYRKRPADQQKTLERKRRWRANADPEHLRQKRQQWYAAEMQKPENKAAALRRAYKGKLAAYGLTPEDYTARLNAQGGQCAICLVRPVRRLAVDHDHATGRIRGLLCHWCNAGLGFFKDSEHLLIRAAVYLGNAEDEEQTA